MKVFLLGFMGVGKTTMGKRLAEASNVPFLDLDEVIARGEKRSIDTLFSSLGEEAFRKLESQYLKTMVYPPEFVMATGGGTPCFNENLTRIQSIGTAIYLQADVRSLYRRLENAGDARPLLKRLSGESLKNFIEQRLAAREKYYLQADKVVDHLTPVNTLLDMLR